MSYSTIINEIKQRNYQPIYFLYGDEPYYIDRISKKIEEEVLEESQRAFNLSVLYGLETDYKQVIGSAREYPVGAEYKVVILKEAQMMRSLTELQPYFEQPNPTTILVICYKKKQFDKRTKFAKVVQQKAHLFESKPVYDNKIPGWISDYIIETGYDIAADATMLLSENIGNNLSRIVSELEKLTLNMDKGAKIQSADIEKYIGISREYNVFELTNAIGADNFSKAQQIINYFSNNPKGNPLVVTLGALYSFFNKIMILHGAGGMKKDLAVLLKVNPFFIGQYETAARRYDPENTERIIGLLSTYDLRSKGIGSSGTSDGSLLLELVFKIMHEDAEILA